MNTKMEGKVTELASPIPICVVLPVGVEQTPKGVTVIDDSKWATLGQNETAFLIFWHVMNWVESVDIGDEGDRKWTVSVAKAVILERLV